MPLYKVKMATCLHEQKTQAVTLPRDQRWLNTVIRYFALYFAIFTQAYATEDRISLWQITIS
jgi:hypothetical protein